ncbi:MAG: hypothetical protein ACOCYO_01495 [Bacteroidota bacterium]
MKASLRKAGAADDVIEKIAADIENRVYDCVTTDKIYAHDLYPIILVRS